MRVVFVLPHAGLAGGTRVVATYASQLQERGHAVTAVSTPPFLPLRHRVRSLLRGEGWPRAPKAERGHLDDVRVRHHILERSRPVTDGDVPDADVVIATWWETAEWVWRLGPSKGAKAYFLQHYEDWGGPAERVDATWRLPMHRIVISRWLERIAREKFGIGDASYVPNGVDPVRFDSPPRRKQAQPTVGFVYADPAWKGCDVALAAVAAARRELPSLRVKVFGSERPAGTHALGKDVEFVHRPPQERIPALYGACDAWLFPSRAEGFGLPLLEAMACRTPVIATPAGAAPELLAEGGGVLLGEPDPVAMADAIVRVCRLPEPEWSALSEAARRVAERHTWDESVRLFEAALEVAIAGEPRRGAVGGPSARR
jgi:glycosyltransferase involved in cell wall biosynthesis